MRYLTKLTWFEKKRVWGDENIIRSSIEIKRLITKPKILDV